MGRHVHGYLSETKTKTKVNELEHAKDFDHLHRFSA